MTSFIASIVRGRSLPGCEGDAAARQVDQVAPQVWRS
jgi:hypothetical protein